MALSCSPHQPQLKHKRWLLPYRSNTAVSIV